MKPFGAILLLALASVPGCSEKGPSTPVQFPDSPEGVVLKLEEALRKHDLDAAAACRAFQYEGDVELEKMLKRVAENEKKAEGKSPAEKKFDENGNNIEVPKLADNPMAATQFASAREFFFRDEIRRKGFPILAGVASTVTDKKVGEDGIVTLTLARKYPDGHTTSDKVQVVQTAAGWRVFVSPE